MFRTQAARDDTSICRKAGARNPPLNRLRPQIEQLKDRWVPAMITVTATGDTIAADGKVMLREAITSINNGANVNTDVVAVGRCWHQRHDQLRCSCGTGVPMINITGSLLPSLNPNWDQRRDDADDEHR